MDISRQQMEKMLDDAGVSARKREKVLKSFDERTGATPPQKASRGHGAPAPDTTQVNVL